MNSHLLLLSSIDTYIQKITCALFVQGGNKYQDKYWTQNHKKYWKNYFNKYFKWYFYRYCHWYFHENDANILCRPARHEVRLPPCGQEADACYKDNLGPKMQDACYKDNLGPKIEENCYKANVRPKSQESDTGSILDEAKLGSSYRHRPKGDVHR